jgi:hypothetical protein
MRRRDVDAERARAWREYLAAGADLEERAWARLQDQLRELAVVERRQVSVAALNEQFGQASAAEPRVGA